MLLNNAVLLQRQLWDHNGMPHLLHLTCSRDSRAMNYDIQSTFAVLHTLAAIASRFILKLYTILLAMSLPALYKAHC